MNKLIGLLGDDIYRGLKEIQNETGVKLEDKALITVLLSQKLYILGYWRWDFKERK